MSTLTHRGLDTYRGSELVYVTTTTIETRIRVKVGVSFHIPTNQTAFFPRVFFPLQ